MAGQGCNGYAMSDWLNWDSAVKAVPIAATALGTLKSWRNHWKGPRSLARFFHREAQLAMMTQDRDYYRAISDELMERIKEITALSDYLDSLPDSDDPKTTMTTEHHHAPSLTPTTTQRSTKPKPTLPERPKT